MINIDKLITLDNLRKYDEFLDVELKTIKDDVSIKLGNTTKYALSDSVGGSALKAIADENGNNIATSISTIEEIATNAKTKAQEALDRNVFTDEEKAKLAGITNPIVIKGRVDTVDLLPIAAEIGHFYFVGLETDESLEEWCYSENGWEFIGYSKEGVDLSDYYNKSEIDAMFGDVESVLASVVDI